MVLVMVSVRKVTLGVVCLLFAMLLAAPSAEASPADEEVAFVKDINALRVSRGVAPMSVHPQLTVMARVFVLQMIARGEIFHNPNLAAQAPAEWMKLGENVGVGSSEASLHQAFIDSSGHLRNLLDGDYKYVGVGVVNANGRMWVVENFMRSDAPLPQVSPPKTAITQKAGLATRFNLATRAVKR